MLVKENTKRERADTFSVVEPQGKKVKTWRQNVHLLCTVLVIKMDELLR
jgi:hypothetical protein